MSAYRHKAMSSSEESPTRYRDLLIEAARRGKAPAKKDLDSVVSDGERAARDGVPLQLLICAYLRELETAWGHLPNVSDASTIRERQVAALAVLTATRRVVEAVTEGHERSTRISIGQEATRRRRFIDDLLGGGNADPIVLTERAERFGVLLHGGHLVAVAQRAAGFSPGDPVAARLETALVDRFGSRNVLITVRDNLLVCVTPESMRGVVGELSHQLVLALGPECDWRIGLGRQHTGASGVAQSYEEARNALRIAERLGLRAPVLNASDLLVFPVLLRDQSAIIDLIATVLGPLVHARGGPQPLLETLAAFFDSHGNTTATARRLNISVRAVTYRLGRIAHLTGYTPTEPTQRFTLEAAVLGAKLLDWPAQALPDRDLP